MQKSENFQIKNFIKMSDENHYFLHAFFTTKERVFTLHALIDEKKIQLKNISNPSKNVFEVYALIPMFHHSLSIMSDIDEEQLLLETDRDEVFSLLDKNGIASDIFRTNTTNNITEIWGWAFSNASKQMNYRIFDVTSNSNVDMSFRKIPFQKLKDYGIIVKEVLPGFIITYVKEEGHRYLLIINNIKMIDLDPTSEESAQAKTLTIANVFKRLNIASFKRGFEYLHENGLKELIHKLLYGLVEDIDYDAWFRRNRITKEELNKQRNSTFEYNPKISILVPTFNTPINLLKEMLDSVINQSYSNWELCIADGSTDKNTIEVIKEYSNRDSRIKVNYLDKNYGISGNTNKALELAAGEYTALFDHDDVLELDALFEVVSSLQDFHHDIIYTDEDKLNNETGEYIEPNLKSDYNEDLLLSHNYITHFFVVKTEILKGVNGFNSEYDGAQDYDVILKCVEKTEHVHHIPKVLYHWRIHEGSTAGDPKSKLYCYEAGQKAIQHHLDRIGVKATVKMREEPFWGMYHVTYDISNSPLVSIIIPNYENKDVLKTCIDSLFEVNKYKNFEVIIVENNSKNKETFDYYEQLEKEHENVHVVKWVGKEFNFSAINNFGVKYAKGEYLLFLNNDTQMIRQDALEEMLGLCMRKDVGIVGAKLLYEDNMIQHAGVAIGFAGYAQHVLNGIEGFKDPGYMCRAQANVDYSAVTAACMMTKKSLFEEVGGFDEEFKVACNDIDYCLKVREMNQLVVFNGFSYWHHFESKSRGLENTLDKVKRYDDEVSRWQSKWMKYLVAGDPYYNKNFRVDDGPYELQ